jgi:hypothetical protein
MRARAVEDAARGYVAAVRANRGADAASWAAAHVALDVAWHDLIVALDDCDLCEPGTCPAEAT